MNRNNIIPVSSSPVDTQTRKNTDNHWQTALQQGFSTSKALLDYLEIEASELPYKIDPAPHFKTRVTRHFANLMKKNDPWDPLLRQVLPLACELEVTESEQTDPLEETSFTKTPGVIHKYKNRVLLIAHETCAIHCRYCFRKHFPYSDQRLNNDRAQSLEYLQNQTDVTEVILSGGDPLSLSDEKLSILINDISNIPHIKTIRIHTRTPVVLPERITQTLVNNLEKARVNIVMVLHINHPNELSKSLSERAHCLRGAGITLLNQTVLLAGINDHPETLASLSEALFQSAILPYYLHQLDPVKGTSHFEVCDETAKSIWLDLQSQVSGYLLPRLVREIPNRPSKTWTNPNRLDIKDEQTRL